MKINNFLVFLTIFLPSCQLVDGILYEPVYLANGYFNNTVEAYIYQSYISYSDASLSTQRWEKIPFDLGASAPARLELSPKGRWMAPIIKLMIRKNNCIIQTYSNAELLQLKLNAGYNTKDNNVVFVVNENNITVVSREEYEKLRPTFKPHSYDASLCKPTQ